MAKELLIFKKWVDFLKWMLSCTEKFPKKVRFTFSSRIDNLSMDILELIIELKFDKDKRKKYISIINIKFEKLRILLRICYDLGYLSAKQFEHAVLTINEVGSMTYSWLKN